MNPTKEALGSVVIADFEARRKEEKLSIRAAHWRLICTGIWLAALTVTVGLQTSVSGRDVVLILVPYMVYLAWSEYTTKHELRMLRSEMNRLKDESKSRSA